jgi:hypothetical protein
MRRSATTGGTTDPSTNTSYTVSICLPGQTNFIGYINLNHFRMPSDRSGGTGNFWYSFDHGLAHFIQLDIETDLGHGFIAPDEPGGPEKENSSPFNPIMNAQTTWLANDLAVVDRSKNIAHGISATQTNHLPFARYARTSSNRFSRNTMSISSSPDTCMRTNATRPYITTLPTRNELNDPKFPCYITNHAAGHYDGLNTLQRPFSNYTRYAMESVYDWSKLSFQNCTHLTHDFVANGNGSMLGRATSYKERTCKFN